MILTNETEPVAEVNLVDRVYRSLRAGMVGEADARSLAAPILSASALSELRSGVIRMADLFATADKTGYLKLHRQFHFGIYEKSDSTWLMHMIETLWGHADRYIHLAVRYERSAEEVLLEH